jgi:hypothetical protein
MPDNDNAPPVTIIELPPGAAELPQRQCEIDRAEAGPKLPVDKLHYRGVDIESRWSVAVEFERMKAVVDALPDLVRIRLQSIWCDSKAQADYSVAVAQGRWAEGIELDVRDAVLSATDGFNGLSVAGNGRRIDFDPIWAGDDYDYEAEAGKKT